MQVSCSSLQSGFLDSVERHASRPALVVGGQTLSYEDVYQRACAIAAALDRQAVPGEPPLTAILGERSQIAYCGVLAALLRGHAYVPLNPAFPVDRTRRMLRSSGCRAMIVDTTGETLLDEFLAGVDGEPLYILLADCEDPAPYAERWPAHRFIGKTELEQDATWQPKPAAEGDMAYLLFTSGSSGVPKGVQVSHGNVLAFLECILDRYDVTPDDRLSQMFDLTFDLSVFDMFVAWHSGASLYGASRMDVLTPARYIIESGLTIWFSVPSVASLMNRARMIESGLYPSLRVSLFCGEALARETVDSWCSAAPNSIVENLYGPTEATIACTGYRWDASASPEHCENGIVPIGSPLAGTDVLVVDENLQEAAEGETGELLIGGRQVGIGYWNDPAKTAASFVTLPGQSGRYYRSGDRVRREAPRRPMTYLGRLDNQIQVRGFRVELGEIESAIRDEAGTDAAVAVGWPRTPGGEAEGVVGFLVHESVDAKALRKTLASRLPDYMTPTRIVILEAYPLNANGKIDRGRLCAMLEEE